MAPPSNVTTLHIPRRRWMATGFSGIVAPPETSFSFGPFSLFPRQYLLFCDDNPVQLGSRAFEILVALLECAGELLDKDASSRAHGPVSRVEESNLRAQITALRRVLAEGGTDQSYVVSVPGTGVSILITF
jgi:DNA-binding winged helix-turn-helix (wHTH) protein